MKKLLPFYFFLLTSSFLVADDVKLQDIRPGESSDKVPTSVEWENAHNAKLAMMTTSAKLAAFVANERTAKALLAQLNEAYRTDALSACQIAAVSQWVMLPDPWYCLWWDGEHAAGRKVWVRALLQRAETAKDDYVKVFCLDQLRWCGCKCSDVIDRITALGATSDSKAVKETAGIVIRELSY